MRAKGRRRSSFRRYDEDTHVPEGDTIHGAADRLDEAMAGSRIEAAGGTHRAMIEFGKRIVGTTLDHATAHGKHLLMHFSNGWTLRTHLRMTGVWHLYEKNEPWRKSPGKARVVIETADRVAVCFAAPTVQLAPRHIVAASIEDLGPDLMAEQDFDELAMRLVQQGNGNAICDVIMDQRQVAGLGNVYKSELLFEVGVHPDTPVQDVPPDAMRRLLARGHQLLNANRGEIRTTTGSRARGATGFVYGRSGKPCRRCGTEIEYGVRGPLARHTYWCPSCQPSPLTDA